MKARKNLTSSSTDEHIGPEQHETSDPLALRAIVAPVRRAIGRARAWLLAEQLPEGCWCAELEGDTILESETILCLAYLGRERSELARQLADYLIRHQLPEGGWAAYPGGGAEISGSVKAYFALKLAGHDPSAEYMRRARQAILDHGGADAVNSYTRYFLAILGQISYDQCPAVPPEIVLLPRWFPVNLHAMSAWSRTILVPLSIISARQPVRHVPPELGIRELFLREPKDWPPLRCPGLPGGAGFLSWDRFFRLVDRGLKFCQRHRLLPLRRRAIRAALQWMLERFQGSDGLGAIYPPIIWSIVALRCLGYQDRSPELQYCHQQLQALMLYDDHADTMRVQPCRSPVWDTAISLRALTAAGAPPHEEAIGRAVQWLLDKQIRRPGDWAKRVAAEPGGWCFEFANEFYPDNDDTAMVLMALRSYLDVPPPAPSTLPPAFRLWQKHDPSKDDGLDPQRREMLLLADTTAAIDRGLRWLLAMQNSDGGWGAFDRNNNSQFLCYVPFADHNAMIDPSTADVTGRVLEALGALGLRLGHPAVERAVAYIRRAQEADGSWFGRWGVNYVYGTWQAVAGLRAVGVSPNDPAIVAAANWLIAHQQTCGGWGESPATYDRPHLRGQGVPTASQTAWAVLGLIAAGMETHSAVRRGIKYLVDTQNPDGSWTEPEFTGTGFPRVFYLRYHYYPIYFPLLALGRWAATIEPRLAADGPDSATSSPLRITASGE